MSLPVWLDPRTLRWLADEAQCEADNEWALADRFATSRALSAPDHPTETQLAWLAESEKNARRRHQVNRRRAVRLRGIATRVERRRKAAP